MRIRIDEVIAEGTTQARQYDEKLAAQYAQAMSDGAAFPPIVAYRNGDGRSYLADGFHRIGAAKLAGVDDLPADIREPLDGETAQRSAILFAVGANDHHGRNRSNEEKRHAVEMLLRDPQWSKWTDREIARQCRVSNTFVSTQRSKLINRGSTKRKRTDKHGNISEIETKNIGKRPLTDKQKRVAKQAGDSTKAQSNKAAAGWTKADDLAADAILDALSVLGEAWTKATRAAQLHTSGTIKEITGEMR